MEPLMIIAADSPSLTQPCEPVSFTEGHPNYMAVEERNQLALDMGNLMVKNGGAGLSAPQVGRNIQLLVYLDKKNRLHAYFNPKVTPLGGDHKTDVEGCLTFPGKTKRVRRARKVMVEAFTPHGTPVKFKEEGLVARVIQHEADHLQGKMIFDSSTETV